MDTAADVKIAAFDPAIPLPDVVQRAFDGPLAAAGFPVRPGQIAMARAVAGLAMGSTQALAVEAPTGTGKSLAYLVPAVLMLLRAQVEQRPQNRVVVSTSGIALQAQILKNDLPKIASALGIQISAAVLKGRSNYACVDRLESERMLITNSGRIADDVANWIERGGSGDREEIPFPVHPRDWSAISVSTDECLKGACPHHAVCPANRARVRALSSGIIIVNHWYLALAGKYLQDADRAAVLVVDEAHDLVEALRGAGSAAVRESTARHWHRVVSEYAGQDAADAVGKALMGVVQTADACRSGQRQVRLRAGWAADSGADTAPAEIETGAERIRAACSAIQNENERERARAKAAALSKLAERVARIVAPGAGDCAWADTDLHGRTEARVAPVMPVLPPWSGPIVACSATLGGGGRPETEMRDVLGRPGTAGLVAPSPWPIDRMAVAIVPDGPLPNDPVWPTWVEERAVDLCRQVGGGALILATSNARANQLAARLRMSVPFRVRAQGEASRTELLDWFRTDVDGVLVGTRSLFQGVDVPGDALRAVLIDRVPFPSPGDPLEGAICDLLRTNGRDPFTSRSLAYACTVLRQGAGRLIRSVTDRGVIMLTDPRIHTANWGPAVLAALYPMPTTRDPDAAGRLWRGEPTGAKAAPRTGTRSVAR